MSSVVKSVLRRILDVVRGALIGIVEIIPGVSGGTIALIVGVYDTLIDGAGHVARGVARLVGDGVRGKGVSRAVGHFRSVRWGVVVPIVLGMLAAIVIGAALLAPLIEEHPVGTRAVFAGLIAASLMVPIRMVGGMWRAHEVLIGLAAAALTFFLTGLPAAAEADPSLVVVSIAAAFAVCALVLPGVSGSYLLLTVGMYEPTLDAVNDRNFAYLGAFVVGAAIGLGLFVSVLQWLLSRHRRITLVVMTGLMLGSLRALWPWQSDDGGLQAPGDDLVPVVLLFVVGAVVVLALIGLEGALLKRRILSAEIVADPEPHSVPDEDAEAISSDEPSTERKPRAT